MDCLICFEKPNKSTRSPTTCASCASVFCRECVQAYLLQDENRDPICPNTECKKPWTHQFLYDTLTAKFRLGPYKAHREKILFDQQKARLPDTQEDARRYKDALEIYKPIHTEICEIRALIKTLPEVVKYKEEQKIYNDATRDKWHTLKREDYILWRDTELRAINARHYDAQKKKQDAEEKYLKKMRRLYDTCREADYVVNHFGQPYPFLELEAGTARTAGTAGTKPQEKRAFIMKCPQDACEGFLSAQYKCGLCDVQVCAHCLVKKTDDHVCDPATVETIRQIKKEARPCPKCASFISKIDGCDQMWCTQCHTAFSWNTGQIETRVIHNPHYFQWMRSTGQNAPRRDIPGIACEEVRDFLRIAQVLRVTKNAPMEDLQEKYRQLIHIRETTLRGIEYDLNQYNEDEWRRELRVKRLVGEIDDSTWKDRLQRKEKAFYKQNAWYQLLDMYTATGLEMFGRITLVSTPTEIDDVKNQLKQLNEYVSNESNAISKVYGCVIPSDFTKWKD